MTPITLLSAGQMSTPRCEMKCILRLSWQKRPNRMQSMLFCADDSWSFRISYHIVWPWNFESFMKSRNESSFGRGLSAVPITRCMYILSAISLTGSSNIFEHLVWMWSMRNCKSVTLRHCRTSHVVSHEVRWFNCGIALSGQNLVSAYQ